MTAYRPAPGSALTFAASGWWRCSASASALVQLDLMAPSQPLAVPLPAIQRSAATSGPAGLSGNPALVEGVAPLEALAAGAGAGACAAGPVKATGCANADGELMMTGTGALLTGALWRPTE